MPAATPGRIMTTLMPRQREETKITQRIRSREESPRTENSLHHPFLARYGQGVLASWMIAAGVLLAQDPKQEPQPVPQSVAPAAPADQGTLRLEISGSRMYCVKRNEVEIKPGSTKPRQYRNGPLTTTFGYKYQISAIRRGSAGVVKLFESPTFRTAYREMWTPPPPPPGPPLPISPDAARRGRPTKRNVTRWIPENTCALLSEQYSFPLLPGHYDVYLGFDLLLGTGQWVPLQSDFVTDVVVEESRVTRVHGSVGDSNGIRTVKLDSADPPEAPASQ